MSRSPTHAIPLRWLSPAFYREGDGLVLNGMVVDEVVDNQRRPLGRLSTKEHHDTTHVNARGRIETEGLKYGMTRQSLSSHVLPGLRVWTLLTSHR